MVLDLCLLYHNIYTIIGITDFLLTPTPIFVFYIQLQFSGIFIFPTPIPDILISNSDFCVTVY